MNPKNLSPRLKTALALAESAVLADIGCDHAYLPIAACLSGKAGRAIACDVNPGPLERARKNIGDFNLQERIDVRLGNGLSPLAPGEADCIVMAGMGGMKIIDILTAGMDTAKSAKKLILSPQHDARRLKEFLTASGFIINEEIEINEGRKHYIIMKASAFEI